MVIAGCKGFNHIFSGNHLWASSFYYQFSSSHPSSSHTELEPQTRCCSWHGFIICREYPLVMRAQCRADTLWPCFSDCFNKIINMRNRHKELTNDPHFQNIMSGQISLTESFHSDYFPVVSEGTEWEATWDLSLQWALLFLSMANNNNECDREQRASMHPEGSNTPLIVQLQPRWICFITPRRGARHHSSSKKARLSAVLI